MTRTLQYHMEMNTAFIKQYTDSCVPLGYYAASSGTF